MDELRNTWKSKKSPSLGKGALRLYISVSLSVTALRLKPGRSEGFQPALQS